MTVAFGEDIQDPACDARDLERVHSRHHELIEEVFDIGLVDVLEHARQRASHRLRDDRAVFSCREPPRQRLRGVVATQSPDDHFGCQEVLFDEVAETLRDALLVLRNDRRVRDRYAARSPEQRDHRIPICNRTDRAGLGKGAWPSEPRIRALPDRTRDEQDDHRREQTGRRRAHALQPNELLVRGWVDLRARGIPVSLRDEAQLASCRRNRFTTGATSLARVIRNKWPSSITCRVAWRILAARILAFVSGTIGSSLPCMTSVFC